MYLLKLEIKAEVGCTGKMIKCKGEGKHSKMELCRCGGYVFPVELIRNEWVDTVFILKGLYHPFW